jgi:hypothetical protein
MPDPARDLSRSMRAALAGAGDRRYREHRDPDTLPLHRHLVVTGAWWDLVDTMGQQGGDRVAGLSRREALEHLGPGPA